MMNNFYVEPPYNSLRFGDILQGYVFIDLIIKKPIKPEEMNIFDYNINVSIPEFCIILTPCCSIEKSVISICPLTQIKSSYLKNEYLKDDLTRINRRMSPRDAYTNEEWDKLGVDKQTNLNMEDDQYAFLQNFIYAPHPRFNEYNLKGNIVKHYLIDFKNVIKIKCNLIDRNKLNDAELLSSKIAEMSVDSRHELRQKITNFYSRVPDEDRVE